VSVGTAADEFAGRPHLGGVERSTSDLRVVGHQHRIGLMFGVAGDKPPSRRGVTVFRCSASAQRSGRRGLGPRVDNEHHTRSDSARPGVSGGEA